MLKAVTFLALVSSALSVCPRYAVVNNLNLRDQVGTWNIHGVIRTLNPSPNVDCLQASIQGQQFTTAPIHLDFNLIGEYGNDGDVTEHEYEAIVPVLSRPGMWQLFKNGTRHEFSLMHTDYIEYSVMITCAVIDNFDVVEVYFASRYTTPISDGIRNRLLEFVSNPDYELDLNQYTVIQHGEDCQYDNFRHK